MITITLLLGAFHFLGTVLRALHGLSDYKSTEICKCYKLKHHFLSHLNVLKASFRYELLHETVFRRMNLEMNRDKKSKKFHEHRQ